MSINVVLDPNKEGTERFIRALINDHYAYLKSFKNDVRIIRDDDGEICALVPRYHISFKDGSDMVAELNSPTPINPRRN